MDIALGLVAVVAVVVAAGAVASRFDLPAPLLLIVIGIIGSYLPFVPDVELSPEVVLVGLLPPLLYSAALGTSLVDFNANRRSILLLSIGLVVFTAIGVGAIVHMLLPDLSWGQAIAIGAVVAPPDAVAATTIGRRIGLPRRLVTILEGESLLNDATALVTLRTALAASLVFGSVALDFLVAAGGGVLVGLAVFFVIAKVRRRISDPLLDSGLSFIVPFGAYVGAEELHVGDHHASGVIAVVVAGLLLGHKAPVLQTAQSRIQERMNWNSIAFLLENTVFLLIGLQAYSIIRNAFVKSDVGAARVILVCAVVLVAVVLLRLLWVFPARYLLVRPGADANGRQPSWKITFLLGWAGMRGVVTLAAVFVIPRDTPHFDVLVLIAFVVTAGTLFGQGLSLPWLARRFAVPSADPAADALARANLLQQASHAAIGALAELKESDPYHVKPQIKERLERRNFAAWESVGAREEETPAEAYARIRRQMINEEREYVLDVRSGGKVPSEVVSQVLSELDVEESMLDYSTRERSKLRSTVRPSFLEGDCDHLRAYTDPVEPDTPGECGDCLREGLQWVHLRMCTSCGHIGCCDSSPGRHATAHFHSSDHPVMRSAEPGEDWRWCFVDGLTG